MRILDKLASSTSIAGIFLSIHDFYKKIPFINEILATMHGIGTLSLEYPKNKIIYSLNCVENWWFRTNGWFGFHSNRC